jgi:hypothetical protein
VYLNKAKSTIINNERGVDAASLGLKYVINPAQKTAVNLSVIKNVFQEVRIEEFGFEKKS